MVIAIKSESVIGFAGMRKPPGEPFPWPSLAIQAATWSRRETSARPSARTSVPPCAALWRTRSPLAAQEGHRDMDPSSREQRAAGGAGSCDGASCLRLHDEYQPGRSWMQGVPHHGGQYVPRERLEDAGCARLQQRPVGDSLARISGHV